MNYRRIPTGEATELVGRDAWAALVEHFGWPDEPTQPMPLDELPAPLSLQPTERDAWARVLGDQWSTTHER